MIVLGANGYLGRAISEFKHGHNVDNVYINTAGVVHGIDEHNDIEMFNENLKVGMYGFKDVIESGLKSIKFIYVGSQCMYPDRRSWSCSTNEEAMWDGLPEKTHEGYGLAKRMVAQLGEYYRKAGLIDVFTPVFPNFIGKSRGRDIYGKGSHVVQALVKKFCDACKSGASSVQVWGNGRQRREFIDVDDAARAIFDFGIGKNLSGIYNFGSCTNYSIQEVAEIIKQLTGYKGDIVYDESMPMGPLSRKLDNCKAEDVGWKINIPFETSIKNMIEDYSWSKINLK